MAAFTVIITTLIFLLAGAAIVCVVFLAVWLPAIYLLKVKRKRPATLVAISLVCVLYFAWVVGIFWRTAPSSVIYENYFGMPPGIDVVDLRSEAYGFADSGHVYMQFKCSRATLDSLVASQGMIIETQPRPLWDKPPTWWTPGPMTHWSEYYKSKNSTMGFGWEEAELIYNGNTQQANYYWQGID